MLAIHNHALRTGGLCSIRLESARQKDESLFMPSAAEENHSADGHFVHPDVPACLLPFFLMAGNVALIGENNRNQGDETKA